MLNYGLYLKNNGIKNITVDIYGNGDYVEELNRKINIFDLKNIIEYKGATNDIREVFKQYDFVIDFSRKQSFGMTYIEAIFNGKPVLCMHNEGADEILKDMPDCFFNTYSELTSKINHLERVTKEEKIRRYKILEEKYSRMVVAEKLIELINSPDYEAD